MELDNNLLSGAELQALIDLYYERLTLSAPRMDHDKHVILVSALKKLEARLEAGR